MVGKRRRSALSLPNEFGLYDMVGNVFDWIEDCGHTNYNGAPTDGSAWLDANDGDCTDHIVRGGSWANPSSSARSATAAGTPPSLGSSMKVFGWLAR